jgi:hypothetical protein
VLNLKQLNEQDQKDTETLTH